MHCLYHYFTYLPHYYVSYHCKLSTSKIYIISVTSHIAKCPIILILRCTSLKKTKQINPIIDEAKLNLVPNKNVYRQWSYTAVKMYYKNYYDIARCLSKQKETDKTEFHFESSTFGVHGLAFQY